MPPDRARNWVSEILFVASALITGASVVFNWFVTGIWQNRAAELGDFAAAGAWKEKAMPTRIGLASLGAVLLFYAARRLLRFLVSRFVPATGYAEKYRSFDTWTYLAFFLTALGFFGIYADVFAAAVLFVAVQAFLGFRLFMRAAANGSFGPTWTGQGKIFRLFFVSGFAALIYQIAWQRVLFQFYGVNIESVTIIVAIFMFGLGIGSIAGGLLSRKYPSRLPGLFVLCESIVGIFGLASLKLIDLVGSLTLHWGLFGVSLAVFGLLLVPTIFMGATLPILADFFYRSYRNVGKTVSLLYFINTLGSALACFFTVFVLFLYAGVRASVLCAALFNFVVVFFGIQFIRADKPRPEPADAAVPDGAPAGLRDARPSGSKLRYAFILFLAAATAFVSMSQEILWMRILSYATGGRASVFPVLLGFILLGIAAGSWKAKSLCEKYGDSILAVTALLLVISAFAYHAAIPVCAWLHVLTLPPGLAVFLMYLAAGTVAFLMGAVFPMLTHFAIRAGTRVGFSLSWIYFSNIVGSTAGPLFTGFFLLEWLSFDRNVLLISGLAFLLGLLTLARGGKAAFRGKAAFAAVAAAAVLSFAAHGPLYDRLFEKLYFKRQYTSQSHFKYSLQNRSGTIDVIASPNGDDIITGGGVYDGRFNTSLLRNSNGIDRAYLFAALHTRPRSVLEIGLSSGSWARVMADDPDVESMDIVEINPGYLSLLSHYRENGSVLQDPRVSVHVDDGRRWLLRSPKKFDFILMNTTFYWRSEINNLVSEEFLRLCRDRLNPGGVLYYNTTYSRDIPFTAARVFKFIARYKNFIAVSDQPFPRDPEVRREGLTKFVSRGGPVFEPGDAGMIKALDDLVSADLRNLRNRIVAMPDGLNVITDDNLASEFKTGRRAYSRRRSWMPLLKLLFVRG
jgi:spermidine synthase